MAEDRSRQPTRIRREAEVVLNATKRGTGKSGAAKARRSRAGIVAEIYEGTSSDTGRIFRTAARSGAAGRRRNKNLTEQAGD